MFSLLVFLVVMGALIWLAVSIEVLPWIIALGAIFVAIILFPAVFLPGRDGFHWIIFLVVLGLLVFMLKWAVALAVWSVPVALAFGTGLAVLLAVSIFGFQFGGPPRTFVVTKEETYTHTVTEPPQTVTSTTTVEAPPRTVTVTKTVESANTVTEQRRNVSEPTERNHPSAEGVNNGETQTVAPAAAPTQVQTDTTGQYSPSGQCNEYTLTNIPSQVQGCLAPPGSAPPG